MIKHSIRCMARGFVERKRGIPQFPKPKETLINTESELLEFLRKEGIPINVPETEKKVTTDTQLKSL